MTPCVTAHVWPAVPRNSQGTDVDNPDQRISEDSTVVASQGPGFRCDFASKPKGWAGRAAEGCEQIHEAKVSYHEAPSRETHLSS